MSAASEKFVDTILQLFPPFRWEPQQEERWMEIMGLQIGGFSDEVLERALASLVRREEHRMPTVGECVSACVEAKRWLERDKRSAELPIEGSQSAGEGEWSSERQKLAYDLLKTQTGRQAASEGWILALWDFCRKNRRLPTHQTEIAACKRSSAEFDETYAKCIRGGWPQASHWAEVGEAMLAKRERMRAEVLGK